MNKKHFNGFASEEQYEAVLEIIKNEIDNCCYDTLMIEYDSEYETITIYVDDYVVFIEPCDGVYEVKTSDNSLGREELCVIKSIDDIYEDIFNEMED